MELPRSAAELDGATRIATLRLGATNTDVERKTNCFACSCMKQPDPMCTACAVRDQIKVRDMGGADAADVLFLGVDGGKLSEYGLLKLWARACADAAEARRLR